MKTKTKNSPVINPFDEKPSVAKRKISWKIKALLLLILGIGGIYGLNSFFNRYYLVSPVEFQSPVRIRGEIYPVKIKETDLDKIIDEAIEESTKQVNSDPVKSRENNDTSKVDTKHWTGQASVYSEEGCLGCSPTLTMANGETFTNQKIIVAFNRLPLNSKVKVTNLENGLFIEARVADRGGFEKYNRIVDLGKATAEAINCNGLCQVRVEEI